MTPPLDLTVLIPTVPERGLLFSEAHASVLAQTQPVQCAWRIDTEHEGPATMLNRMVRYADTEWIFRLDDDDLLDPDHFEVLSHWLDDDADIVFTWCRIEGGGEEHPPDQFQVRWQAEFGWEHLDTVNWIPCSAAIRTSFWRELGGLNEEHPLEDWDFWQRALRAGARFRCIPAVTWTYRMNPEWEHRLPAQLDDGTFVLAETTDGVPLMETAFYGGWSDHAHGNECCAACDTHVTPHVGCVLR